MAIKTFYLLNTTAVSPDWNGSLQDGGTAPTAAVSTFGWTVAKTAAPSFWRGRIGASAAATVSQTSTFIGGLTGPSVGTGSANTTAGDTFSSATPYTGTFATGTWAFTFALRCTTSSSQAGGIRYRVWAGPDPAGGNCRELTSGAIAATTVTLSSTTTTFNSTSSWSAPVIVLVNEYLFIQVEWNGTVASGSNNGDVKFYQSAALFTTPDFQPATGKTYYPLNTTATGPNWFGSLQEGGSAPTPTNSQYGWVPSTTAVTTPYYPGFIGATGASPAFSATSALSSSTGPKAGTGNTFSTAGDSFISPTAYFGSFAAGNWVLSWALRGSTVASTGQVNCRVWASVNANGSAARQLTTAVLQGSIVNIAATTVTYISTVTWSAPAITLNGEYLFFEMEWQETTAGTNSNSIASFYISAANILTANFTQNVGGGAAATDPIDTSVISGLLADFGPLAATDPIDTAAIAGQVVFSAALAATDLVDAAGIAGTIDWRAVLAATDAVDTAAITGSLGAAPVVGTLATTEALDAPQSVTTAPMLASYTPGNTRSGSFWVGAFIIPTTNQTVTQIGCLGGGNSGSTTVTLVDQSTGTILADTTVNLSAPSANGFCYGTIPATTLIGGHTYVVAANSAPMGGWADVNGSYATYGPDFTGNGGCYNGSEGGPYTAAGGYAYWQYVGVDLLYGTTSAGFSGALAWQGTLVATDALDGVSFTGLTAAFGSLVTVEDTVDTVTSGAGTTDWRATFTVTDPLDTSVMAGTAASAGFSGTLAATDLIDTSVTAGTVTGVAGILAATDGIDTAQTSGSVLWNVVLAATDLIDHCSGAGAVITSGALTATDPTDTANLAGTPTWNATLSATGPLDTADITGFAAALGTLSQTDALDTAALSGVVFNAVSGTLTATDILDTAAFSGSALSGTNGSLNQTDPADVSTITGSVTGIAGTLQATEFVDSSVAAGLVAWSAVLGAVDPPDLAATGGTVRWNAALTTQEGLDTASVAGVAAWNASLAASETPDMAALVGTVFTPVSGTLSSADPIDQGNIAGSVLSGIVAVLAVIEPQDHAALGGSPAWGLQLVGTDPTDIALFLGEVFAIADAVVTTQDFAVAVCLGSDLSLDGVPDDETICLASDQALYYCLADDQRAEAEYVVLVEDFAIDLVLAE